MSKGSLFVVSGCSGVGKSTVLKPVMASRDDLGFSVSATTRAMREGEVDGKDYFFISREEFLDRVEKGEFLEYDEHNATLYGTLISQVENQMEKGLVVLDIEPVGAFRVKEIFGDRATLIFILPPDWETLENRLRNRGDTAPDQIAMRLERAKWELEQASRYDFTVVNDVVEDCAARILNIIAEKADGMEN